MALQAQRINSSERRDEEVGDKVPTANILGQGRRVMQGLPRHREVFVLLFKKKNNKKQQKNKKPAVM